MDSPEKGVRPGSPCIFLPPDPETRPFMHYITWCGHYICNADYVIDRPAFPDALLCYIEAGEMIFKQDDTALTARGGDAVLMNCTRPHRYQAPEHAEFYYYNFNGPAALQLVDWMISENGSILFRNAYMERVREQMKGQISLLVRGLAPEPVGISQNIYNCLSFLAVRRIRHLDVHGNTVSARAVRFMQQAIEQPITVADIADAVNLSSSYFSRQFRKETGDAPASFLIRLRIRRAEELLRTTDLSIEAIALRLGYENPSSFTNLFTQKTGMSPRRFRKIVI